MKGRRARTRIFSIALVSVLGVIAAVSACSNMSEGERCQIDNLNEDCENGLTCTPSKELVQPFSSSDRCCPPNRDLATTAACKKGTGTVGTNPPDGSTTPDATVTDAADAADAAETATDAADAADSADADDDGG